MEHGSLSPLHEDHEQTEFDRHPESFVDKLSNGHISPQNGNEPREQVPEALRILEHAGSGPQTKQLDHLLQSVTHVAEPLLLQQGLPKPLLPPSTVGPEMDVSRTEKGEFEKDNILRPIPTLPSPVNSNPSLPVSPIPESDLTFRRLSTESHGRPVHQRSATDNFNKSRSPISPASTANGEFGDAPGRKNRNLTINTTGYESEVTSPKNRPSNLHRAQSTPAPPRSSTSSRRPSDKERNASNPSDHDRARHEKIRPKHLLDTGLPMPSPMPKSIPLPPVSIPTYLQLELSSQRPAHGYIHRSANSEFPYESSRAKIERLQNFLYLPVHLEAVLWFGMLACLDSWLYTFTILPLRLLKSFYILAESWTMNAITEFRFLSEFVYSGSFRVWRRRAKSSGIQKDQIPEPAARTANGNVVSRFQTRRNRHHRRMKSMPSNLMPDDKADILKGLLILCTCVILLRMDASRMYHWIRGQSAVKLYVMYNVLEVCDRLFSALGQDVLECLFSRESLERKPDGHSKVLRPFWLFVLALGYTIVHSTALFYQVITLNVAVNAYSNALITLLLSNQFVEIKSTVFKKFEKENLFQLTCADVVERFQLWHMLIIIAARNIAETGSPLLSSSAAVVSMPSKANLAGALATNITTATSALPPPQSMSSIVPLSFTLIPDIIASLTSYVPRMSHVLGPFVIVLGSEMFVDWLKHAYINKFNNTRPAIYDRFLDVLAKDYYTNAFGDQNLTKRLGLPVIPLSCLLIRASVQTYQMFVASWVSSSGVTTSTASLASIHEAYTSSLAPAPTNTTLATSMAGTVDNFLRNYPSYILTHSPISKVPIPSVNFDTLTTHLTTLLIFVLTFLILLALKLILGMLLLAFARNRYRSMKEREEAREYHVVEGGRRVGGWGVVEVDEDKRRWIYDGDADGLRALHEREARDKEKGRREKDKDKDKGGGGTVGDGLDKVKRYEMVAKRIW